MIKKMSISLKNSNIHNYVCLLNGNLGSEYENKDNVFLSEICNMISKKKEYIGEYNSRKRNPGDINLPDNIVGCVSYCPNNDGDGYSICTIGWSSHSCNRVDNYIRSAMKLIREWMEDNKQDACITESLYDSLGDKHAKTIREIIMDTFNNSTQTLYIARKNRK